MGIVGRYHWLGKLRDWLRDNSGAGARHDELVTGKVRTDAANEPAYLADTINFYGTHAAKFIGDDSRSPPLPLLAARSYASSTGRIQSSASSAPQTSP